MQFLQVACACVRGRPFSVSRHGRARGSDLAVTGRDRWTSRHVVERLDYLAVGCLARDNVAADRAATMTVCLAFASHEIHGYSSPWHLPVVGCIRRPFRYHVPQRERFTVQSR
jgi:hypothetical protein